MRSRISSRAPLERVHLVTPNSGIRSTATTRPGAGGCWTRAPLAAESAYAITLVFSTLSAMILSSRPEGTRALSFAGALAAITFTLGRNAWRSSQHSASSSSYAGGGADATAAAQPLPRQPINLVQPDSRHEHASERPLLADAHHRVALEIVVDVRTHERSRAHLSALVVRALEIAHELTLLPVELSGGEAMLRDTLRSAPSPSASPPSFTDALRTYASLERTMRPWAEPAPRNGGWPRCAISRSRALSMLL